MFNKVKSVQALSGYNLLVCFANGEQRKYSVTPLFSKWKSFQELQYVDGLFEQVRVDTNGYGISWNDDIDLSCNELYENGVDASNRIA